MDGNRHEKNKLDVKYNVLKWVKTNNALPKGSP
jgi:hypothetical protein